MVDFVEAQDLSKSVNLSTGKLCNSVVVETSSGTFVNMSRSHTTTTSPSSQSFVSPLFIRSISLSLFSLFGGVSCGLSIALSVFSPFGSYFDLTLVEDSIRLFTMIISSCILLFAAGLLCGLKHFSFLMRLAIFFAFSSVCLSSFSTSSFIFSLENGYFEYFPLLSIIQSICITVSYFLFNLTENYT
ncbi:hypothetical protein RCL1_004128 [Eukaryota sp. TZLM3-RCL]